jgi:3-hydroxyacyl-CoA dehydrogenase
MSTMVEKGILGRKVGKGFYLYPANAKKGSKEKQLNPEVRVVFALCVSYSAISESFQCCIPHRGVKSRYLSIAETHVSQLCR